MKKIITSEGEMIEFVSLQELRILRGVQQQDLARRLGVAPSVVSRYESVDNPTLTTLRNYIQALNGQLFLVVATPGATGPNKRFLRMPGEIGSLDGLGLSKAD